MQPRGRDAGQTGRRLGAWAVALWVLAGVGCLNLDLPTVPQTPPAPYVKVISPRQGDTVSLSTQVSVEAASVNGIGLVNILCGPLDGGARTVYSFPAPPYLALVDLSRCEGLTQPGPADAGTLPILQLSAQAFSDAGAPQQDSIDVFLNTKGPVLSVQYPPTAQPKAPFTVLVTSDIPLRSFPEVTLDAHPATNVTATQGDAGQVTYSVFFSATPGLGTDNYPYSAGVPIPIEVLTETSRTVRLAVSATASNGNSTQLDLAVDLTRLVWDRYIPGKPAVATNNPISWAAQPVAFAGGLEVPLATSTPASDTSAWIPGLLRSTDGTFSGFDTSLLPGGLDGGYLARGLNAQGQSLFFDFNGNGSSLLLAPPPGSTGAVVTSKAGPPAANAPLTRVDNLLCLQDSVTACSVTATEGVTCYDTTLSPLTATVSGVSTGPPSPGVVAGAAGNYLSPNVSVCGSSWNLMNLTTGAVSFGSAFDLYTGCPVQGISKLLAVPDGTFVVQLTANCAAAGLVYPIYRVGPSSNILGVYTAASATPSTTQEELVGVLADGRVVTLSNAPPYTNFELWSLNSTTPDIVTPVAGLYDTADATLASVLAESVYSGSDGSFAVLLSGATLGVGILAFGPDLQPLWLYVYPRVTDAFNSRLVAAASLQDVYFIDLFNNRALSLRARPVSLLSGITVSGVVMNANGAVAPGIAVVVSSGAGTQNTTSDSSGAFTFLGVQTPYTLSAVDLVRGEVTSYQGLTIPNPTIQHALDQSTTYSASITVTVDGGAPEQAGVYVTSLQVLSPEENGVGTSPLPNTGLSWTGTSTTTARLTALQVHLSDAGYTPFVPVDFPGYATLPGLVLQNGSAVTENLRYGPVTTGTISGTVTPPAGSTLSDFTISLVSDANNPNGIAFVYYAATPPTSFSYKTPSVPGTTLLLQATSSDGTGNSGHATLVGLSANSANLTINIPAAPTLLTPANNATGVTVGAQLTCSPFSGGIYHFVLSPDGYGKYDIWSNTPSATIPDLRAAGVPLPPNNSYQWWVEGTAPITSVDQLAGPYLGNTFIGQTAFWNLTTGP